MKKTKKMTFLQLHKKCLKTGKLPDHGLCNSIIGIVRAKNVRHDDDPLNYYFHPIGREVIALLNEGKDIIFWASGLDSLNPGVSNEYTPLRQTILLLLHEILKK